MRRQPRRGGRTTKVRGVGEEIRRALRPLEQLAAALNQPQGAEGVPEIVEATLAAGGPPAPFLPPVATRLYNALVRSVRLGFRADPVVSPTWPGVALIRPLLSPGAETIVLLNSFVANPVRDRLRRCLECRRWFVDVTRNKSARRCSRACTITWSNKQQRAKGGSA